MARKQIGDIEGVSLAQMVETNGCLRKLELEGNLLGTQSASAFGKALKKNKTLRYLDLESNQLTADGALFQGVCDLAESLLENNALLSLNLANNMMDEGTGKKFRECIMSNTTLIDFDFSMNNFVLEDSRAIQDYLRRNKAMYDAERLKEWKERKLMRSEDEQLKELYLQEQSKKEQARMEEEQKEIRESELNEKWRKFMLETEIEKNQII